jgi:hypothetical protein
MASWVISQSEDIRETTYEAGYETPGACKFQGFVIEMGFLASLSFNASLAVLYLLLFQYHWSETRVVQKFLTPISIALWIVSIGIALIPLGMNYYHDAGPNCWIAEPPQTEDTLEDENLPLVCHDDDYKDAHPDECKTSTEKTLTNLLFCLQVVPIVLCVIVDSVIMFIIYRKTRAMEDTALTRSFFGVAPSSRSSTAQENNLDWDDDSDEEAGEDITPQDNGKEWKKPNKLPTPITSTTDAYSSQEPKPNGATMVEFNDEVQEALPSPPSITDADTVPPTTHNTPAYNRRSRIIAVQGLWYIGGFFFTYGVATLSILIFLAMGEWNTQVYRASYFFMALQGAWNFVVFSRGRRAMKTCLGRYAKWLVWETKWCRPAPCCHCVSKASSMPPNSAPQPPPPPPSNIIQKKSWFFLGMSGVNKSAGQKSTPNVSANEVPMVLSNDTTELHGNLQTSHGNRTTQASILSQDSTVVMTNTTPPPKKQFKNEHEKSSVLVSIVEDSDDAI